jgi:hypothetical protein
MKRKVLFVASLFLATATFAQDGLTSKKGEAYLPEAGDWSIGFDGTPFLNFAGNLLNGTQNNTMAPSWAGNNHGVDQVITGKMFKDENTAYRASLRIGFGSNSTTTMVDSAAGTSNPGIGALENKVSNSDGLTFAVGAGIEKRKGNTRIQGYYGAEAFIGFESNGSTTNDYGFAMDSTNVANGDALSGRQLESKNGSRFTFGLRGFVGVEWFVAPKVSLGAEYGWGIAMNMNTGDTGAGETTTEIWNATDQAVETVVVTGVKDSSFGLDTDNNQARIKINFHF